MRGGAHMVTWWSEQAPESSRTSSRSIASHRMAWHGMASPRLLTFMICPHRNMANPTIHSHEVYDAVGYRM